MIGSLMLRCCRLPHYSGRRQKTYISRTQDKGQSIHTDHAAECAGVEVWHTWDCSLICRRAPTDEGMQCIALTEMDES